MPNNYRNSGHCGQEVIDLKKLMGRSSEVIINVDSQTEIQVKLQENKSKICTVVKKSSENIPVCDRPKKRGMCPISESMSDGSMDMANYQRRNRMSSARRQESCMDDLMFGGGRNVCGEKQRKRMSGLCDDPCKDNRRAKYGSRDMYDNNTHSSMRKSAPCDFREKRREDPCKMIKKDPCAMGGTRKTYDPCMEDERDFYQPPYSKGTRYDERCECSRMNEKRSTKDPCQKKDPCAIQKDLLKKYPCLTMPKDTYGNGRRDSCRMREDPCKIREDPCKMREDPCKMRDDPCKRKDPCKKPKEDPCKPRYQDPCEKKRVCPPKSDPCKPERKSRPSADLGRYETCPPCPPCVPQDPCADPCRDPCDGYNGTPDTGASKDGICEIDKGSKDSCKDDSRTSKDSTGDKDDKNKNMDDLGLEDAKRKRSSFELGPDEEVWIVQCPKTVDLRGLVGAKIKLGASKTSLKTDELSIDCSTHEYPENRTLSLAAGNGKIRQMDTVGSIKIKKRSASNPNVTKTPVRTESIKRESSKYSSPEIMSPKRKKSNTQN